MTLRMLTASAPESPFLTCEETALRWKCSKSTIYRRVAAGALDTIGQGALLRITLESVLRYEAETKNCRRAS